MKLSFALPSSLTLKQKEILVKKSNEAKLGIFLSDLPPNHDLFQLLTIWASKYSNIHTFGTAIVSPLIYDMEHLKKQVSTIFELHQSRIEIGFGVGDRKFVNQVVTKPFQEFKKRCSDILPIWNQIGGKNLISLAGSGKKLMKFAKVCDFGLIFNGIPDQNIVKAFNPLETRRLSCFVMADFSSFDRLAPNFIKISTRILSSLSVTEMQRLNISSKEKAFVQKQLKSNKLNDYKEWLDPQLLKKISFFGTKDELLEFLHSLEKLKVHQTIFSFPDEKCRELFFSFVY